MFNIEDSLQTLVEINSKYEKICPLYIARLTSIVYFDVKLGNLNAFKYTDDPTYMKFYEEIIISLLKMHCEYFNDNIFGDKKIEFAKHINDITDIIMDTFLVRLCSKTKDNSETICLFDNLYIDKTTVPYKIRSKTESINKYNLMLFFKYIYNKCSNNSTQTNSLYHDKIKDVLLLFNQEEIWNQFVPIFTNNATSFIRSNLFSMKYFLENDLLRILNALINNIKFRSYGGTLSSILNENLINLKAKDLIELKTLPCASSLAFHENILELFDNLHSLRDASGQSFIFNYILKVIIPLVQIDCLINNKEVLFKIGELFLKHITSYDSVHENKGLYTYSSAILGKSTNNSNKPGQLSTFKIDEACSTNEVKGSPNTDALFETINYDIKELIIISMCCYLERIFSNRKLKHASPYNNELSIQLYSLMLNPISMEKTNYKDTVVGKILDKITNKNKIDTHDIIKYYFKSNNFISIAIYYDNDVLLDRILQTNTPNEIDLIQYLQRSNISITVIQKFLDYKLSVTNKIIETFLSKFEAKNLFDMSDPTDLVTVYYKINDIQILQTLLNSMTEPLDPAMVKKYMNAIVSNIRIDSTLINCLGLKFDEDTFYACYITNTLWQYWNHFTDSPVFEMRRLAYQGTLFRFKTFLTQNTMTPDNYCCELAMIHNAKKAGVYFKNHKLTYFANYNKSYRYRSYGKEDLKKQTKEYMQQPSESYDDIVNM
jgi:hypothetical protein